MRRMRRGRDAAPEGSASSAKPPGASGDTARPNYVGPSGNGLVGADERGGKPAESRAYRMGAPVRLQKAVSSSKEKPQWGAERRAGPRHGSAIPSADGIGLAARQTNGRGVPRLRISALRYPLMGMRRVRNRQFGTTARRDAPRGNDAPRLDRSTERK